MTTPRDLRMIDFIEATKFIDKGTISFQYLKKESEFASGYEYYTLDGCKKMMVKYNPNNPDFDILKISGSVMYFAQGHNFTYNETLFVEAIDYVGKLLGVQLWDMMIDEMEYGIILNTPRPPKDYIRHHQPSKGLKQHEGRNKDLFRWYDDQNMALKMYDAGRNIQHKQDTAVKEIIESAGWNPSGNYLKLEVHYRKPEVILNHDVGIKLANLVEPKWQIAFKKDLLREYNRLRPMKSINKPKDKSELHTSDILARELVESKINEGIPIEDVKKSIYERINSSPLLSNADKDARKRQVKAVLDKLKESESSEWDLKEMLMEELGFESDPLSCN